MTVRDEDDAGSVEGPRGDRLLPAEVDDPCAEHRIGDDQAPSSRIAAQLCPSHVSVPAVASTGDMGSRILALRTGTGNVPTG